VVTGAGVVVGWSLAGGVVSDTLKLRAFMSPLGQYVGSHEMLTPPRPPEEWMIHLLPRLIDMCEA
jgi:hypothetical protein